MISRQISQSPCTYALIFETGDEVLEGLKRFAEKNGLKGSSFKAIGALSQVRATWFDWESKQYRTAIDLDEQVEVLTLTGDIALDPEGRPAVHGHLIVGRRDGTAHGGHLARAIVRPTLELVLTESPLHLQKHHDSESGLALIRD